ncbi:ribonuclease III [Amorphus sp. 3PC139-8]|uniref:ribonuclease III n=1 Tax=Amorphus sp. 3PC139-8 TaxID=2735676 RepID=UPI00345CD529
MSAHAGDPFDAVEAVLGHRFQDRSLLATALTHASALTSSAKAIDSYQRLEFLGDRVLGLAVAALIYQAYPEAEEGELAQRYNQLVKGATCAEVAKDWGLDRALNLSAGEAQAGGRRKTAILADVCEAVLGALFIDAGFETVRAVVVRDWEPRMRRAATPIRDAKTTLQEWIQGRGGPTPIYRLAGRSGPDHQPRFVVEVAVAGLEDGVGEGGSKREAEQNAARAVLMREGVWRDDIGGRS